MSELAIEVRGLTKTYGSGAACVEAVRGIDFTVRPGQVLGLLGPNGAGKTTTVEILEGLRPRSGGQVAVLGLDPEKQADALKQNIGVCLQATKLPDKMKVREAMDLFAAFYPKAVDTVRLLDRLQLGEKRDAFYSALSGGQKQRVAIALALINDPKLVFFDEPTTGLDPQVRLEIHKLIEELRRDGRTIVLTTHYIEEAERLCDQVAIIDQGKIIAQGTPSEIQARTLGETRITVRCERPVTGPLPAGTSLDADGRTLHAASSSAARKLAELLRWVDEAGFGLEDLSVKKPTLEDVFIELTGKRLRD